MPPPPPVDVSYTPFWPFGGVSADTEKPIKMSPERRKSVNSPLLKAIDAIAATINRIIYQNQVIENCVESAVVTCRKANRATNRVMENGNFMTA